MSAGVILIRDADGGEMKPPLSSCSVIYDKAPELRLENVLFGVNMRHYCVC